MEPGRQLAMFMTPKQIKDTLIPNDGISRGESPKHVWKRKLRESKSTREGAIAVRRNPFGDHEMQSLHDHIAEHGVKQAILIGDARVFDGHHRVAAAANSRPNDLVPVIHAESMDDARAYRSQQSSSRRQSVA